MNQCRDMSISVHICPTHLTQHTRPSQHALPLYESRRMAAGDLVLRSQSLCRTNSTLCAAKYSGFHLGQLQSLSIQQVQQA